METVKAKLNYLAPMKERPFFCGPDMPGTNLVYDPVTVEIHNARMLSAPSSLEREGFTLVEHPSSVSDIQQVREERRKMQGYGLTRYGAELAEVIKNLSGASEVRVVPPGFTGRNVERRNETEPGMTMPAARFVHWDYTDLTARTVFLPQVARIMAMDADAVLKRYQRVAIYQTWRALSGPSQDVPLTVVDGRTVQQADLIDCGLEAYHQYYPQQMDSQYKYGDDKLTEFSLSRYRPEHRWYYFPNMRRDELLVFKGYEYDTTRQLRVLHTAFDDPNTPSGTPPRTSIEVRLFAFLE